MERRNLEVIGVRGDGLVIGTVSHSQDIIATDWEALLDLSENLDNLLADPPVA